MRSKCNVYIYRVVRPSGTRTLTVVALSPLVHSRSLSLTPTRTETLSLSPRVQTGLLSPLLRAPVGVLSHTQLNLSLSPPPPADFLELQRLRKQAISAKYREFSNTSS